MTRLLMTGVLLTGIVLLLAVIIGLWRRLIAQAAEALRHKGSLEGQSERLHKQAVDLEVSNLELAAAIRDKEYARAWQRRFNAQLRGSGSSLMVGVNLSGRHLAQPELVNDVAETLRISGLAPSHLVLEMTESMLVHDNRATLERLHSLKALGVRLSIDDFGTGYSSLAYLERFPVDSLKMDRSFIAGLGNGQNKSPLAEAVIGLGRILGLRVVAEGIETREQWDRLKLLGCTLGQGFHISRPLAVTEFEKLIVTSTAVVKGVQGGHFPISTPGARRSPLSDLAAIS